MNLNHRTFGKARLYEFFRGRSLLLERYATVRLEGFQPAPSQRDVLTNVAPVEPEESDPVHLLDMLELVTKKTLELLPFDLRRNVHAPAQRDGDDPALQERA